MRCFRTFLVAGCFFTIAFLAMHSPSAHAASTQSAVVKTIEQVFGNHAWSALQVATCESGLNPSAYNPSGATGLFQIIPSTWNGTPFSPYSWAKATDLLTNTQAAYDIFKKDGYSWQQWGCKPSSRSG
jgi:soluble lytic murein transglycosylase-like protein